MNGNEPPALGRELRAIKRIGIAILVVFAALASVSLYNQVRFWFPATDMAGPPPLPGWREVRSAVDAQHFDGALSLALELTDKAPDYYYGHTFTGTIYLAMGEPEKAEACYARAYALYPSEENLKALEAVRRRLGKAKE